MVITYQTIEWLLIFLLGIEAFQLEIVFLIALFIISLFSSKQKGSIIIYDSKEFSFLFLAFLIYYCTLFIQSRASLSVFYIIRSFLGATLAYIIGMKTCKGDEYHLVCLIEIIAVSGFFHGFLNAAMTTTFSISSRYVRNIWTGGITTATLQGTYFTCSIALASLWILGKNVKKRIFGIVVIIITIWNCMMTASRTAVYLIVILFAVSYFLMEYHRKGSEYLVGIIVRTIIGLGVVAFGLYEAYSYNLFGIQTRMTTSFLGLRIAGISKEEAAPRSQLWLRGFNDMLAHPFGYAKEIYAHNMWLDFGVNGGIIPFILLVMFSISTMVTCIRYIKQDKVSYKTKSLIILTLIAYNINFMLEPVLDGVPFMFFMYCMICGAVQKNLYSSKYISMPNETVGQ